MYVAEGTVKWRIGKRRRKVNNCICPGTKHQHSGYEEARRCYLKCPEAQLARKQEIQKLLDAGGNPCPQCGDVFADHSLADCMKHPYLVAGDQGFQNALNDGAYVVLERLEGLYERLTKGVPEGTPCISCAGDEEPHDYRGCLKRLKCKKGKDGEWVSEPPSDPSQVPPGRFQTACTMCGSLVPDHQVENCKEKQTVNYGLLYMLEKERPAKVIGARKQKCQYLNGGLDLMNAVCKSCKGELVREEGRRRTFHDPEQCLNRWIVYRTKEGALEFKPRTDEPINRCISSQHTHTTWDAFMKCQEDQEERQGLIRVVQQFKGDERRWCRRCTDYFAKHRTEECPHEGGGNPTLAKLLETKDVGLFRLFRVVIGRLSKQEPGPCPVCQDQDPEHDVQECVRTAHYSKEDDQLVVKTKAPDPEPEPEPEPPTRNGSPGRMVHATSVEISWLRIHRTTARNQQGKNIGL